MTTRRGDLPPGFGENVDTWAQDEPTPPLQVPIAPSGPNVHPLEPYPGMEFGPPHQQQNTSLWGYTPIGTDWDNGPYPNNPQYGPYLPEGWEYDGFAPQPQQGWGEPEYPQTQEPPMGPDFTGVYPIGTEGIDELNDLFNAHMAPIFQPVPQLNDPLPWDQVVDPYDDPYVNDIIANMPWPPPMNPDYIPPGVPAPTGPVNAGWDDLLNAGFAGKL